MWKVLAAGTMSLMTSVAWAQGVGFDAVQPPPISGVTIGQSDLLDGGWLKPRITADAFMQEQQDRRLGIMHSSPDAAQAKGADGPKFDITGKLIGALQYHWKAGTKPELGLRGIPIRAKIKTNGVYFGFSWRPGWSGR